MRRVICIVFVLVLLFTPGNTAAANLNVGTVFTDVINVGGAYWNLTSDYYNKTEVDNQVNACMADIAAEATYRQGNDTAILSETWTNVSQVNTTLNTHTGDTGNPHSVTAAQLTITDSDVPNDITITYATMAGDADTVDGSHASAFMSSSVEVRFTEWDGAAIGTEFVATDAGIAIMSIDPYTNVGQAVITIDKDNAGSDIKTYRSGGASGEWVTTTAPFDKGDGVTISRNNGGDNWVYRVYYFSIS